MIAAARFAPVLTSLQREVLRALLHPGSAIRWHGHTAPRPALRGRGQVLGTPQAYTLLANYTVRSLVGHGYLTPVDAANRRPFGAKDTPPFRDYTLSPKGRAACV